MSRILTQRLATLVAVAWLVLIPVRAEAQKALVYCPVGVDATGCNTIVAALAASSTLFPDGVDAGYDGTSGTVDLAGGDLSGYAVFVVPSLADGPDVQPYALLRNGTIAARLQAAFMGRVAVWSGTPDVGSTNRVAKDNLIRNLAGWARADVAGTHGPGLVALQDNSDDPAARYGWLGGISQLSVTADNTLDIYSNVQVLTTTGQTILTSSSGLQIGYTNMASYGLAASGASADATGGRSTQVVLATIAGDPSDPNRATVTTDREDYAPGDTVIVTGSGWAPGEIVDLLFHEEVDPPIHPDRILTTVADGNGAISNGEYVIDEDDVDVRFVLTATGQASGRTAQTTFTDGNRATFSTTAAGAEVTDFGTINVSQCVPAFVQARQGGALSNETGTVPLSSSPAGVTFFSSGNCTGAAISAVTFANETAKTISFRFAATGSFTLNGNAPWSNNSNDATASVTVKQAQTISFTSTAPAAAVFGGAAYTATATATSGLTVSFSSLTPSVCTSTGTNGATITPIAVGTCTVAADQPGNATFNAAPQVTQTYSVGKANQTITFNLSALPPKTFGDADFSVAGFASASSGLTVSFSSGSPSRCTVSAAGLVHIISAAGNCMVNASQAGDANYNAAPNVQQTFNVAKAGQTVAFTSTAPVGAMVGGANYTATATATSGLTVTFSSSTTGVCTSSGTNGATITFVGGGTCTVAANQTGNGDYNAAPQVTQSFAVSAQVPQTISFTSTAPSNAVFGGSYAVTATATSSLTVTFSSLTTGVCTVAGSTVSSVGVGNCTVAANQAGNASFLPAPQVTQTFAVGKANQTITFAALADKTYGDADFGVSATASSLLAPTFSASGQCTVSTATVHLTGTGSCTITASQAGNANYNAAPDVPRAFTINQASLTGSFTASDKPYDGTTAATILTRTLAGVSGSDGVTLTGGTATFADKNVGNGKTVSGTGFTLSGPDAGKYVLASTTLATVANITPVTVTGQITANNKAYDGTTAATLATHTLTGVIGSDVVTLTGGTTTFADKHVGTGKTVTGTGFTLGGADGGNYVLASTTLSTTADITVATATGHFTADSKPYDATTAASILTRTLTGTVGGDAVSLVGGTAAFDTKNAGTGKTVTGTGFTLGGADAGNYVLASTTLTTTADIAQATVTGTITASDKVYDGTTAAALATRTLAGVLGTDVVSLTGGTATFANKNVGAGKTVTATGLALGGADAGNYILASSTLTATANITVRTLTVTASASDKVYDATTAAAVTLGDDRVSGDALTVSYAGAAFDTKHVGAGKTVTVSGLALSGGDAGNYTLASTSATTTADITSASLTPQITASDKIYDGTAASTILTRTLDGILATDVVSLTGGTATFANKNVGAGKAVTGTGFTLAGADAGNYVLDPATATTTASITQRSLTVTATADDKVYDGTTDATAALADDRISGDVLTVTFVGATFDTKNVSPGKTVTVSGIAIGGGADAGNYHLGNTTATATASITPASVAPHITASDKAYDGTTGATIATRTLTGVIAPDVVTLTGGTATFATKDVGAGKTVTGGGFLLSGSGAGNYQLDPATATATADITPRDLVVTATGVNKVYDGTTATTVTLSDDRVSGDVFTASYTVATFADKNVANGKTVSVSGISIGGADAGNYHLTNATATTTANITTATATGHFTASNKAYEGTTAATITGRTLTGILGTDDVSLVGGTATFSDKNVGAPKTVTGVGFSLAGGDGPNYVLATTTLTTSANITRRDLTVAATGVNKIYDGTADATVTLSDDRVAGDVISDSHTSATFANKNVGNGKPISVTGISIGSTDAGNYTLLNTTGSASANITVATATGHFTAANKTYDGSAAATILTRTLTGTFGTDDVSLIGGTSTFSDKHAGVGKTVTGSGFSITGGDVTNYVLASSTLTTSANIDQRPVAVTADAKSKIFGQGDPPLTYFISSGTVVAGDPFSGALTRTLGEAVGSWPILQGTLTLGPNYILSYVGASLTIGSWTATGFYQPVDMPTGGMILNSIKGGQTVPLKFEIFAGTVEKTDVSAVQSFALTEVSCPSSSTIDDIELTSTGGTVLRYDGPAGQFIQNWQTPKTAGKCYKVTLTAADAVSKLIAYFKTK